jgi:hypothetical protein
MRGSDGATLLGVGRDAASFCMETNAYHGGNYLDLLRCRSTRVWRTVQFALDYRKILAKNSFRSIKVNICLVKVNIAPLIKVNAHWSLS